YVNAGGIAPNVVHDKATIHYFIRAPKMSQAQEIYARVQDIAEGAAKMTGTTHVVDLKEAIYDYLPNITLSHVMEQALNEIGAPEFDENDYALAQEFRKTFNAGNLASVKAGLAGLDLDTYLIGDDEVLHTKVLPYKPLNKAMSGSTDVGDASYCAPTAQCGVATEVLGTPGHSWQITALSNSSIAHKGTVVAAKVLALTAAMAIEDKEMMAKAKAELKASTGGGYVSAMPAHIKPNV
ncbi:MAG: amidohydrolase, partial [Clostridia bacterium]|nr:amidohydrolase [Clostridia bacterium]